MLPAAEHMFTAEIGYPPYRGSDRGYRASLASLAARGHTSWSSRTAGSCSRPTSAGWRSGCAQLQGVWLPPSCAAGAGGADAGERRRAGDGRAGALVTLYVNDYNTSARATYARLGFREVGDFATVLL